MNDYIVNKLGNSSLSDQTFQLQLNLLKLIQKQSYVYLVHSWDLSILDGKHNHFPEHSHHVL